MRDQQIEPRYGFDSRMGLIFDATDCLTMKEVAARLNDMTDRIEGMNELFADIRKVVGGNSDGGYNHIGDEKPINYTLPWLPHSLMLRIDAAMNQEHRG